MEFAKEIASRILYMDEHGIYEEGSPQESFEAPKKKKTRDFVHKMKYLDVYKRQTVDSVCLSVLSFVHTATVTLPTADITFSRAISCFFM